MSSIDGLSALSDQEVLNRVHRCAGREAGATAALVASLGELDARKLYRGEGYSSTFTYCTERLHLSESAAYRRIAAARLARRFPVILERLATRELTLTAIAELGPCLTEENHRAVLDEARHLGTRAIEELVARLRPRPDVRASIRKLPEPKAMTAWAEERAPTIAAGEGLLLQASRETSREAALGEASQEAALPRPARPAVVRPLAPARYQVQLTVSAETHAKLRRAQDLLRHAIPTGDPAAIVDRALTVLLQQLEQRKCALPKKRERATAAHAPAMRKPRRPTAPRANEHAVLLPAPEVTARPDAATAAPPAASPPSAARLKAARGPARSRHIPAAVRRAVWIRDEGRCTYVGADGHRCGERGLLEYHHRVAYAECGPPTIENLALACRSHNAALEAEREPG